MNYDTQTCPKCGADFTGEEIPVERRHEYGNKTHFSRLISMYSLELDRTMGYKCPDCGYQTSMYPHFIPYQERKQAGFFIPIQAYFLLAILVVGAGAVLAYNHAISKAERLEQERDAAIVRTNQLTEQIYVEREQISKANAVRAEAEKEMAAARERVTELEGLFARHDFDDLLQKKPGLIVPRANAGTQRVQRELEAAASD